MLNPCLFSPNCLLPPPQYGYGTEMAGSGPYPANYFLYVLNKILKGADDEYEAERTGGSPPGNMVNRHGTFALSNFDHPLPEHNHVRTGGCGRHINSR
jgi:hypothetical protein